ncbi:hypothetical protein M1563_03965, partial [Patescibacteria group bacterium]|nr:hypothetical protein [Patescibacteria group bacterium]MCL5409359.1 hypothetical protein [Patescibacteria group bacterium]
MFKVLNKKILTSFLVIVLVVLLGLFVVPQFNKGFSQGSITTTSVQNLPGQVIVAGSVSSESIANLSFLTAGKLTYLPLQEGSQIKKGQVVAAVDPTQAQQDVTSAQAEVQSAQAALNKVLDDIHLFQYGNGGFANVGSANETQTQKTQRQ